MKVWNTSLTSRKQVLQDSNHPYQYHHALFTWAAKQDYIPYNPFEKLELKKVRDEGNVQPAEIRDIQALLKALDKHNYTELRDYNIVLLVLDTGIRTSELMAIANTKLLKDYGFYKEIIYIMALCGERKQGYLFQEEPLLSLSESRDSLID